MKQYVIYSNLTDMFTYSEYEEIGSISINEQTASTSGSGTFTKDINQYKALILGDLYGSVPQPITQPLYVLKLTKALNFYAQGASSTKYVYCNLKINFDDNTYTHVSGNMLSNKATVTIYGVK